MAELEPMERLRVLAATGGSITLDADTIRLILLSRNLSDEAKADARKLLKEAKALNKRSHRYLNAAIAICVVTLALIWGPL